MRATEPDDDPLLRLIEWHSGGTDTAQQPDEEPAAPAGEEKTVGDTGFEPVTSSV